MKLDADGDPELPDPAVMRRRADFALYSAIRFHGLRPMFFMDRLRWRLHSWRTRLSVALFGLRKGDLVVLMRGPTIDAFGVVMEKDGKHWAKVSLGDGSVKYWTSDARLLHRPPADTEVKCVRL
jgi:hypothetical protein